MKSPAELEATIAARLAKHWADSVLAEVRGESDAYWPWSLKLTALAGSDLNNRWGDAWRWILDINHWAEAHGCGLSTTSRRVGSVNRQIPTKLTIPDLRTAAAAAGGVWDDKLPAAKLRVRVLDEQFGITLTPALARAAVELDEVDFDLLCRAAEWFRHNDTSGLTARQVPIAGLHAKWLDAHMRLVAGLCGRSSLGLVRRPSRVRFSYLDPAWLAAGNRRRDSVSLDEVDVPPGYAPDVILITENKDTALFFPQLEGGIVIEGEGDAASRLSNIPWIRDCSTVLYWGDLDADGFYILDNLRAAGINTTAILMDRATLTDYADYAATTYADGRPLPHGSPKPTRFLTDAERRLLEQITAASWTGPRRIEQERIPLDVAAAAVKLTVSRMQPRI